MRGQVDYKLFFLILALVIFGMIMISSVSVYDSFRITKQQVALGLIDEPKNNYFLVRNIIHVFLGVTLFVIVSKIPYRIFERYVRLIFLIMLVLLILVLIPGVGLEINGAQGWFKLPGVPFLLQPTEFLKLGLILYLAYFLKVRRHQIHDFHDGLIPFLIIFGSVALLVGLQPDLGTLMILGPISLIMFFVGGGNFRYILALLSIAAIGATFLYSIGKYDNPEERKKYSYIYDRVNSFIQSNKKSIDDGTMHHQTRNALIAIGSGGFFGLGFGKSIQKYGFLPEPQGDFIFSIIAEELGFLGIIVLIGIYLYILYKGLYIAMRTGDLFGKYTAIGITSWIMIQACINIGVNLNSFPNTGVTLPFVSYGGSSLLSLLIAAGILLNISREIDSSQVIETRRKKPMRRKAYL